MEENWSVGWEHGLGHKALVVMPRTCTGAHTDTHTHTQTHTQTDTQTQAHTQTHTNTHTHTHIHTERSLCQFLILHDTGPAIFIDFLLHVLISIKVPH
jgi:hypothetical protein